MMHTLFFYTGMLAWALIAIVALILGGPTVKLIHKKMHKKSNLYMWIVGSLNYPWGRRRLKRRIMLASHDHLVNFHVNFHERSQEYRDASFWFAKIYIKMVEDAILATAPKKEKV